MQSKTPLVAGIVIVLLIVGLAFYLSSRPHTAVAPSQMPSTTQPATGNAVVGANGTSQVVAYTDSGFSPAKITIAEGTTVTWTNNSSGKMWVASGNHPDHTVYDGTSAQQHCVQGAPNAATVFDECTAIPAGGSYSFTFNKVGTWPYHNHAHASDMGTVTVTAGQDSQAILNAKVTPN